jgi:hypothetical protein
LREDGFADAGSNSIGANRQLSAVHISGAAIHCNLGSFQVPEPVFNSRCDSVHGDIFCTSLSYLALQQRNRNSRFLCVADCCIEPLLRALRHDGRWNKGQYN